MAYPGAALVDIYTDANALAMPPKVEMKMVAGMAMSMSKLMLGGRWEEVWDTVRSNIEHIKEI
jgi:pyruvate dehydrogenase (quinone)